MNDQYLQLFSLEPTDPSCFTIRLTAAPYEGIVVTLGRSFKITTENTLEFEYDIVELPSGFSPGLLEEAFPQLLGNILLALIEKHFIEQTTAGSPIPVEKGTWKD